MSENKKPEQSLNKEAKEYVPTKNRKLDLNLDAKEYKPKNKTKNVELDEEEDENKFFEKYKNCTCCKGYVYKCNGDTCKSLGQCYCKMSDECESEGK